MLRSSLLGLAVLLTLTGLWAQGAAAGYEHGKAQATAALQPKGSVLVTGPGECEVYPAGWTPDLAVFTNYRAFFVTLLVPDGRR